MILSCGLSNYAASLFHLMGHAFFKSLLFLTAGALIHLVAGEQDIRRLGKLVHSHPLLYNFFLIGSLSLVGFPFFSGFYSKELILTSAQWADRDIFAYFGCVFGTSGLTLTTVYSLRLIYLIFFGSSNINRMRLKNIHKLDFYSLLVLIILSLFSMFFG
jgi:NADH-ubiquinone oxidoreductase chain 5